MGRKPVLICQGSGPLSLSSSFQRASRVRLELVEYLSASSLIEALRQFSNHRSTPRLLISDNATNFTSAAEDVKVLFKST